MRLARSRRFTKHFNKLSTLRRKQARERIHLFVIDPFHPMLNNHVLHGDYAGHRSINASGDLRIIYRVVSADIALLIDIGRHRDLYE